MSGAAKMDPSRHHRRYGMRARSTESSVRRIGKKNSTILISTVVGTTSCWFSATAPSISHGCISESHQAPGNQSLTSIFENQHSGFYESKLKFSKYDMLTILLRRKSEKYSGYIMMQIQVKP
jgi:hypothetical protein